MFTHQSAIRGPRIIVILLGLCLGVLASGAAFAGGLLLYEVGTADVGLASAGWGARAQDASAILTNPAGMTRLEGSQALLGVQALYGDYWFAVGFGTSPGLGAGDGGNPIGWFPGGSAFVSYSASADLSLGFGLAGNFGLAEKYDNNWVGRYYVQDATLLGISLLPSIAYRATDKLSLGASVNAMYGSYKNQVAINNVLPVYGDGQLKLDDHAWGWGVNLGLLYEMDADIRLGLTWNSQVDLDFSSPAQFSSLAPGLSELLNRRGLLSSTIKVGIKVPQQLMASIFAQVNDRWAVLGSVGWQQWSKFGQVELGIDDALNPTSLTTSLEFDDTWHLAAGAQYRLSDPWLLNFGIAYDSGFQGSANVSPLLPVNWAWRFGAGAEHQVSKTFLWGVAAEYAYGGTLDVNEQSTVPVRAGGRGNLVGSYDNIANLFLGLYANWRF